MTQNSHCLHWKIWNNTWILRSYFGRSRSNFSTRNKLTLIDEWQLNIYFIYKIRKKIRTNENNRPVVFVYQTKISERTSSHTFEFKIIKLSLVIVEFQSGHHHRTHFSPSNHANPCQSLDTPQDSVSCNKNFQNLKSIIPTSFQIKTMSDNKATIRPIREIVSKQSKVESGFYLKREWKRKFAK